MSVETLITDLIVAQGTTVKDIRSAMSGNPGQAAGQASAIAATLTANSFAASNLLAAILETDAKITGAIPSTTDDLTEGSTNLYFTDARSIASPLTGIVVTAGAVTATDSILSAIGKLEHFRANTNLADYLPLAGGTMTGNIDMDESDIVNVQTLSGFGTTIDFQARSLSGGSWLVNGNLDVDENNIQNVSTLNGWPGSAIDMESQSFSGAVGSPNWSFSNGKVTNVANGTLATDAVNKGQLDSAVGAYLPLAGGTMTGNINTGSATITSGTNTINPGIGDFAGSWNFSSDVNFDENSLTSVGSIDGPGGSVIDLDGRSFFGGDWGFNSSKITGLSAGTAPTDAVNKSQLDAVAAAAATIDDGVTSLTTTWSSTEIDNRIQSVIDVAPAALDTLNELAAAIGDDANFASTVTTQLSTKANAADVYTKTELGATFTTRDYVADWNTAIS